MVVVVGGAVLGAGVVVEAEVEGVCGLGSSRRRREELGGGVSSRKERVGDG